MLCHTKHAHKNAYTLSELLIALALIGFIASFALPKVIANQQRNHVKQVLRHNLTAIHEALKTAWQNDTLVSQEQVLVESLNYAHYCAANDVSGPCAQAIWASWNTHTDKVRLIMHDGSIIWPQHSAGGILLIKAIATEDPVPPRQSALMLRFNATSVTMGALPSYPITKPGELKPHLQNGNLELYNWVYSN
jgi:prepilin-type N-terminal cleavage/methylation domain-containing protein